MESDSDSKSASYEGKDAVGKRVKVHDSDSKLQKLGKIVMFTPASSEYTIQIGNGNKIVAKLSDIQFLESDDESDKEEKTPVKISKSNSSGEEKNKNSPKKKSQVPKKVLASKKKNGSSSDELDSEKPTEASSSDEEPTEGEEEVRKSKKKKEKQSSKKKEESDPEMVLSSAEDDDDEAESEIELSESDSEKEEEEEGKRPKRKTTKKKGKTSSEGAPNKKRSRATKNSPKLSKKPKIDQSEMIHTIGSLEPDTFPVLPVAHKVRTKDYKLEPEKILGAVDITNGDKDHDKENPKMVLVKFRDHSYRAVKWITMKDFYTYYPYNKPKLGLFLKNLVETK